LLKNGNELRALLALGGLGSTRLNNASGVVRSARHDDSGFVVFVLVLERIKVRCPGSLDKDKYADELVGRVVWL
jgi:hypothetical protein